MREVSGLAKICLQVIGQFMQEAKVHGKSDEKRLGDCTGWR